MKHKINIFRVQKLWKHVPFHRRCNCICLFNSEIFNIKNFLTFTKDIRSPLWDTKHKIHVFLILSKFSILKKFVLRQWDNIYPKNTCVYFVDKLSNRETDLVESRPDGIPTNAMSRISFDTLTLMWIRFV